MYEDLCIDRQTGRQTNRKRLTDRQRQSTGRWQRKSCNQLCIQLCTKISNWSCSLGLSLAGASNLNSYLHFRPAEELDKKSLIQKVWQATVQVKQASCIVWYMQASLDKAIDFLDCIEDDIPKGQLHAMLIAMTIIALPPLHCQWPWQPWNSRPKTHDYGWNVKARTMVPSSFPVRLITWECLVYS